MKREVVEIRRPCHAGALRSRRGSERIRLAAIAIALLLLSCTSSPSGTTVHRDGEGPLVHAGSPAGVTVSVYRAGRRVDATFGAIDLCLQGAEAAIITGVTPDGQLPGSKLVPLGFAVRDLQPRQDPIISATSWPPAGAVVAETARVSSACDAADAGVQELVVGVRAPSRAGGGWTGQRIAYRIDDRDYILELDYHWYVCGSAVQDSPQGAEYCPAPQPGGAD